MNFTRLLSPAPLGSLTLKNRIILAAMGSNYAEETGHCSEQLISYYEKRAAGGAGLLILETSAVAWPNGATMPNTVGFSSDDFLPGLKQLTQRVHQHNCLIAAQLNHGGKVAQEDTAAGRPLLVPSEIAKTKSDMFNMLTTNEISHFVKAAGPDGKGPRSRVMNQRDIDWLIKQFCRAALRAQQANFDAIEIHAGHGYLLSSFLSPATNKRDDKYGGSAENRARLLCEIITSIRETVGADMPILVRLDAKEYRVEGGIEPSDALITAQLAEQAGAHAIDVSAYGNVSKAIAFTEAPLVHQPNGFVDFAKAIKQAVSIPVIAVGRIELEQAEQGLREGHFDFVAMGRKLLADPELPNKLIANKTHSIRPCIYCYVCVSQIFINQKMCCAVNPSTGNEYREHLIASDRKHKRVVVIGGGPAGMEAARTLAASGHRVSLWEKTQDLGGTARIAALAYEPNGRLINFLRESIQDNPLIDIQLNTTATLEAIQAQEFDHVIVATGARREAPPLNGKDLRHVFDGEQLRGVLFGDNNQAIKKLKPYQRALIALARPTQLLRNINALRFLSKLWMPIAKRVTIIGGGLVGLELAEYLIERGRAVTVIEPSQQLGAELSIVRRSRVIHELKAHGAHLHPRSEVVEITPDNVIFNHKGVVTSLPSDQVIIAMGACADTRLTDQLERASIAYSAIGDCREVAYIEGAILDGRRTAEAL